MAISINWTTRVITIPQADLTLVSGSLYELDVDAFRLELKDIEDSEEGMAHPDTHRHNSEVVLSGVTYARTFEIINGYTITFENGSYSVRCIGANHNIADVKNVNSVSLIVGNSAGLVLGGTSPTDLAESLLDLQDVETGLTVRKALRLIAAATAAKVSGAATSTVTIRNAVADDKNRMVATVDGDGNRSAITYDLD